jgi:hypothetical protein
MTVDFLEDYSSDPSDPRIYLLNIRCVEFTTPQNAVAASHSDIVQIARSPDNSARKVQQLYLACQSGEYCQLETSPLVPRHLLPIINEVFATSASNLEDIGTLFISKTIIDEDRSKRVQH